MIRPPPKLLGGRCGGRGEEENDVVNCKRTPDGSASSFCCCARVRSTAVVLIVVMTLTRIVEGETADRHNSLDKGESRWVNVDLALLLNMRQVDGDEDPPAMDVIAPQVVLSTIAQIHDHHDRHKRGLGAANKKLIA